MVPETRRGDASWQDHGKEPHRRSGGEALGIDEPVRSKPPWTLAMR
jgi:hypothetical protein